MPGPSIRKNFGNCSACAIVRPMFSFSHNQPPDHLQTGLWGEEQAAKFLQRKGYKIIGRRVRLGRHDEIDLIARLEEALIFIEVKTRSDATFFRPVANVDHRKRHALARAAVHYLQQCQERPPYFRFDIIEVVGQRDGGQPTIKHHEGAIKIEGFYKPQW